MVYPLFGEQSYYALTRHDGQGELEAVTCGSAVLGGRMCALNRVQPGSSWDSQKSSRQYHVIRVNILRPHGFTP